MCLAVRPSVGREGSSGGQNGTDRWKGRPEGWMTSRSIFCGDEGGLVGVNE